MSTCKYNADSIFKHFNVIDFSKTFVGLEVSQNLNIRVDLNKSAYVQTIHNGILMNLEAAREISANHRAFTIKQTSEDTLTITFKPTNECIFKGKLLNLVPGRFVMCLSIIQTDGTICCHNPIHQEIGRYYISGEYEQSVVHHNPKVVDFGEVAINTHVTQDLRLFNQSDQLFVNMKYDKTVGFNVCPETFVITPKYSKNIKITASPVSISMANYITLQMRNSVTCDPETPFLTYKIKVNISVRLTYNKTTIKRIPESLHKIIEPDPRYTYMEDEQPFVIKKKNIALRQFEQAKLIRKKMFIHKALKREELKNTCQTDAGWFKTNKNFCSPPIPKINSAEALHIFITPFHVNLGKVGVSSYGERLLTITNNSNYDVEVSFLEDKFVKYTNNLFKKIKLKVKRMSNLELTALFYAECDGNINRSFPYVIDKIFHRIHPYSMNSQYPLLTLNDLVFKFGMVSSDIYVTALTVRINNDFNESIPFRWNGLEDIPFRIKPICGSIPKKSIQLCNISFDFRKPMNRSKAFEIDFMSLGSTPRTTSVELNIMSRKLGVRFLQAGACFKEIPINLEACERLQLENASKEIATFTVVEPLLHGITIEPMKGIIRPRTITVFTVKVKIACVIEFNVEAFVRINGKENLVLPISAHVIDSKMAVSPKNVNMSRIPGNLITFVPITFDNQGNLKSTVEFVDTGDKDAFYIYSIEKNEKRRINNFTLEGSQSKVVFVKVYDSFRRQFDMYIPFKVNGFIGPPNRDHTTLDLGYYTNPHEIKYEHNPKVKVKTVHREICFIHICGVITIPWITFTANNFEIRYVSSNNNFKEFAITNVSKYDLKLLVVTSKLAPHFSLQMAENNEAIQWTHNNSQLKVNLNEGCSVNLAIHFHPKGYGRFVAVALFYFLKHTSVPYHNLTFIGHRGDPVMEPNMYHIIFPPCKTGTSMNRSFTIKLGMEATLEQFSYSCFEDPVLVVDILDCKLLSENEENYTIVEVNIKAFSEINCCRYIIISFFHECGSHCEVEVCYCFSHCPLTLLASNHVNPDENPYPMYPEEGTELFEHMEEYLKFLQKWMYVQGFRKELYPNIPETIHATSTNIVLQSGKSKGVNASYIHFIRRMAGPLLKIGKPSSSSYHEQSFEQVKEVYVTYRAILLLLRARGANAWVIQAKYLLSYEQFTIFTANTEPTCNADILETEKLLADENLYKRLNKQSWFDFILQSYKVFVIDTCFFECVCIRNEPRDVIRILIEWYNQNISLQYCKLVNSHKPTKIVKNIVDDLTDGMAIASVLLTYCPFLQEHFKLFKNVTNESFENDVINNACLVIEAFNTLKLFFPLNINSFLKPNFLEMFFLSVHLFVIMPMFTIKEEINFNPPLLRSSIRQMIITPSNQESLTFNYYIFNDIYNNFVIEKIPTEKEKKVIVNVKYQCNFLSPQKAILLVHGFNKTRIFDTYITFALKGEVGSISPMRKYKVVAPLYRLNKVDIQMLSPFDASAEYEVFVTDIEPELPVTFESKIKPRFYLRRLNPVEETILLKGSSSNKDPGPVDGTPRVYFNLICLSNQIGTSWVWFRSAIGEFYIRILTSPRCDLPIDQLDANMVALPLKPCSCGEECECYRTTGVLIPHRNQVMINSLRQSLEAFASPLMLNTFDKLIESVTGRIVLTSLLEEGGVIMSEVKHILQEEQSFKITSRSLKLHSKEVTLAQFSPQMFVLPITVMRSEKKPEKFSINLISNCGLNVRTYKIVLTQVSNSSTVIMSEERCSLERCSCSCR